jgi:hypothetical protein
MKRGQGPPAAGVRAGASSTWRFSLSHCEKIETLRCSKIRHMEERTSAL